MKKTVSLFVAAAAAGIVSLHAGEVCTLNKPGDWRRPADFAPTKDGALKISVETRNLAAAKPVKVDPAKSYRFSLKARLAPGSQPTQVYFIAVPRDEEGRTIYMYNVTPIKGSEGTLAADCQKEDTFLMVKPASRRHWGMVRSWRVCLNAEDQYADLPNYHVTPNLAAIENAEDGVIKVTLRTKVNMAAKAGTPVRLHAGGSYLYVIDIKPTAQWTEYSGTIKGILPCGWKNTSFPVGTESFTPTLMANWGKEGCAFEIKDVKIEEL